MTPAELALCLGLSIPVAVLTVSQVLQWTLWLRRHGEQQQLDRHTERLRRLEQAAGITPDRLRVFDFEQRRN